MNERILELAKQAGFMVDQSGSIMVCFTSNGDSEVKKFAELIVQECANMVEEHQPRYLTRGQAQEIADTIKQHFGVEE